MQVDELQHRLGRSEQTSGSLDLRLCYGDDGHCIQEESDEEYVSELMDEYERVAHQSKCLAEVAVQMRDEALSGQALGFEYRVGVRPGQPHHLTEDVASACRITALQQRPPQMNHHGAISEVTGDGVRALEREAFLQQLDSPIHVTMRRNQVTSAVELRVGLGVIVTELTCRGQPQVDEHTKAVIGTAENSQLRRHAKRAGPQVGRHLSRVCQCVLHPAQALLLEAFHSPKAV